MGNSQLCRCVCDSSCPNDKSLGGPLKDEEFLVGTVETRQQTVLKQKCEHIMQKFDSLKADYDKERQGKDGNDAPKSASSKQLIHIDRKHEAGTRYRGYMLEGNKHGWGVFTYVAKDNSHYEGQWEQNKARGIGRFQDPSGEYLGEWIDGEKHGLGIEKWNEDGTVFKGTYQKGLKEGEGVYIWGDGSSYEGQLKDNQICGEGRLTDDEGVYVGQFMDNAQHGYGRWQYANGDIYIGQFDDSRRHGEGTLKWVAENKQYSGQWADGVPHGKGVVRVGQSNREAYYINGRSCTRDAWTEHAAAAAAANKGPNTAK